MTMSPAKIRGFRSRIERISDLVAMLPAPANFLNRKFACLPSRGRPHFCGINSNRIATAIAVVALSLSARVQAADSAMFSGKTITYIVATGAGGG